MIFDKKEVPEEDLEKTCRQTHLSFSMDWFDSENCHRTLPSFALQMMVKTMGFSDGFSGQT